MAHATAQNSTKDLLWNVSLLPTVHATVRPGLTSCRPVGYHTSVLRSVVDSSSLRSIGYDAATLTLEVEFKNGSVYRYSSVPTELWSQFRRAESMGKFFQERVRDQFDTTRLV